MQTTTTTIDWIPIVKGLNDNCDSRTSFGFDDWRVCNVSDKHNGRQHCWSGMGTHILCGVCTKTLKEIEFTERENSKSYPQGILEKMLDRLDQLEKNRNHDHKQNKTT